MLTLYFKPRMMFPHKSIVIFLFFCVMSLSAAAQIIVGAEGIHPENACAPESIYYLTENKAKPLERIDSIEARLNAKVSLKQYPSLEASASIQFVVNCRSELGGGFHIVTSTGNASLDASLLSFFKTIVKWKAGVVGNKAVDSWYMWRLSIKNGRMIIVN